MFAEDSEKLLLLHEIPDTPLGPIHLAMRIAASPTLVAVEIGTAREAFATVLSERFGCPVTTNMERTGPVAFQIQQYLSGRRQTFDLPVDISMVPPFHRRVLQAIAAIPYGQVRTYGELASQLGNPRAARAVGRASATNPAPLVIPCHRLIGVDGSLKGYRAPDGIRTKAWLLELEGVMLPGLAGGG